MIPDGGFEQHLSSKERKEIHKTVSEHIRNLDGKDQAVSPDDRQRVYMAVAPHAIFCGDYIRPVVASHGHRRRHL